MRVNAMVGTVVALGLLAQGAQAQEPLQLYAVVLDSVTGTPVAEVAPGDLRVTEDGQEAKIVKVEPVHWPVELHLLVDNGQGLGSSNVQVLKDAVTAMLETLPEGIEVSLVSTAPQPRILAKPSQNRADITAGLALLSPDTGVGRFVESMAEATQRIERDKERGYPVIVSVGTSSGDVNVRDRDIRNIFERLQKIPITVHVVILQSTTGSAGGGTNQTQLGISASEGTGGRYESIALANRLLTLLPEIGQQIAQAHAFSSQQFLLTIERPAGKSGDLGSLAAGVAGGKVLKSLSIDGRIR